MLIETAMSQRATFDQQLELALGREAASLAMLLGLVAGWISPRKWRATLRLIPELEQVKRGLDVVLAAVRPPGEVVEPPPPTGPFAGLAIRSTRHSALTSVACWTEGAIVQLGRGDDRLGVFGDWHDRLRECRLAGTPLAQIEAHASAWAGGQANG